MFSAGGAFAASSGVPLSPQDQEAVLRAASAVRDAILHEDSVAILALVSHAHGLYCTDDIYKFADVARFMRDRRSHLYMSLFDTAGFQRACGNRYPAASQPISDRQFFASAPKIFMKVATFGKDTAEVTYSTSELGLDHVEYLFHREGQAWRLTGGFIIGDCTCG